MGERMREMRYDGCDIKEQTQLKSCYKLTIDRQSETKHNASTCSAPLKPNRQSHSENKYSILLWECTSSRNKRR